MREYRIAELASASDTSIRNIRVYQDRGILSPPRREGKIALYSEDHLVRLKLINRLLTRGYTLAVIRDLIDAWAEGRNIEHVLGLETAVSEPWRVETPVPITFDEMQRLQRGQVNPATIARAIELDVITRTGPSSFLVLRPTQFAAGVAMIEAGIPLADVLDLTERLRDDLQRAADHLVDVVARHILPTDGPHGLPTDEGLATVVDQMMRLRPHADGSVAAIFAAAMATAIERSFTAVVDRMTKHAATPAEP